MKAASILFEIYIFKRKPFQIYLHLLLILIISFILKRNCLLLPVFFLYSITYEIQQTPALRAVIFDIKRESNRCLSDTALMAVGQIQYTRAMDVFRPNPGGHQHDALAGIQLMYPF